MRRNQHLWLLRSFLVVFVVQEAIFFYEYVKDYHLTKIIVLQEFENSEIFRQQPIHKAHFTIPKTTHEITTHEIRTKQTVNPSIVYQNSTDKYGSIHDQLSRLQKSFTVPQVNCVNIIKGHDSDIQHARSITTFKLTQPSTNFAIAMQLKHNCSKFIHKNGYIMEPTSSKETDFPIAYNLLFYKHFHQVESIMRIIYRPWNFYCLHADLSSQTHLHVAARSFAACFDNVVVPDQFIDVKLPDITSITTEMVCLHELLKFRWKYFINLSGQDYPIKTNRQIVDILTAYGGANDVPTRPRTSGFFAKFRNKYGRRPPVPIIAGSRHVILSRDSAEFLTGDPRVREFLTYLHDFSYPYEVFWASLNNDKTLKVPGGFSGTFLEATRTTWNARASWHRLYEDNAISQCQGRLVADGLCVFGVADLRDVIKTRALFATRFYWDFEPMALRCLREWMVNRTRDDYLGDYKLDVGYYSELIQVKRANRKTG